MTQPARELAHTILHGIWTDQDAETVADAYLHTHQALQLLSDSYDEHEAGCAIHLHRECDCGLGVIETALDYRNSP